MFNETKCEHEYVDGSICNLCGITFDACQLLNEHIGYSKNHNRKFHSVISFENELIKYGYSEKVNEWVLEQISNIPKSTLKINTRAKILFAYIYLAHLHLQLDIDPILLATKIGLDRIGIDDAIKLASGIIPKYQSINQNLSASIVVISPESYIKMLCEHFKIENVSEILLTVKNAMVKNPSLLEEDPQKVAIGAIRYVIGQSKIINQLRDYCKYSNTVIKTYYTMIDNSLK